MVMITFKQHKSHRGPGLFVIETNSRDEGKIALDAGFRYHARCTIGCGACEAGLRSYKPGSRTAIWWIYADRSGLERFARSKHLADSAALQAAKDAAEFWRTEHWHLDL